MCGKKLLSFFASLFFYLGCFFYLLGLVIWLRLRMLVLKAVKTLKKWWERKKKLRKKSRKKAYLRKGRLWKGLLLKISFYWGVFLLVLLMLGCCKTEVVYTCPYGVGWMEEKDYILMSDPAQISDRFADWVLKTNMYCEENNV